MLFVIDDPDLTRVVQELRTEHVVMDHSMGSAEPTAARARLKEAVAQARSVSKVPIYVAMLDRLPEEGTGAQEYYAQALHRELGDGVFVVGSLDEIVTVEAWGPEVDPTLLSLSSSAALDLVETRMQALAPLATLTPQVTRAEVIVRSVADHDPEADRASGEYPVLLSDAEIEDVSQFAADLKAKAQWRQYRSRSSYSDSAPTSPGRTAWWVLGSFLAAWILLSSVLARWTPRRRRTDPTIPDLAQVRAEAEQEHQALAREMDQVSLHDVGDEARWSAGLVAKDAAGSRLNSTDVSEVLGALVLARTGLRDLQMARRGGGTPYRACWFDPRHGEAAGEAGWQWGQGTVEVPVCARCAADMARKKEPETLRVPRGRDGTPEPYYLRDDVWARTGYGSLSASFATEVVQAGKSASRRNRGEGER